MKKIPRPPKGILGWREWVSLPGLGIQAIKTKVDTGARSSALHAVAIEPFRRRGTDWVRFVVHPRQRSTNGDICTEARVLDERFVKSSTGHGHRRIVIETEIVLAGDQWDVEITLVSRASMGFRMLLGRQAVRGRFLVDPGRSYLAGKPPHRKKTP